MSKLSSIDIVDIAVTSVFAPIALWMLFQYFKPMSVDEKIRIALNEEQYKAEDLYFNELAVNHPLVIMDTNSPLNKLKKKTNKIVFK